MSNKRNILIAAAANEKLQRMALEVAEQLSEEETGLIIIGVEGKGTLIAKRIAENIDKYISAPCKVLTLFINKGTFTNITLSEEMDFNNKNILLVDDVSNSGKTLLYALKPLLEFYPKRIQTLVLVERMHKLFPIKSDYVGYSIATALDDFISVEEENGNINAVLVSP